jgi:hypothetical protein
MPRENEVRKRASICSALSMTPLAGIQDVGWIGAPKARSDPGTLLPVGNRGHVDFVLVSETLPEAEGAAVFTVIEQACLPSLRQQAGSFDSGSAENNGDNSWRLNVTASKNAQARCKLSLYTLIRSRQPPDALHGGPDGKHTILEAISAL